MTLPPSSFIGEKTEAQEAVTCPRPPPSTLPKWSQGHYCQLRICRKLARDLPKCPNKKPPRDFPGGSVVKNPPANAGDMGSIPGLGISCVRQATKPVHHNKRSHLNEKPVHCNQRVAPTSYNQRKPRLNNEDPVQPKINKIKKKTPRGSEIVLTNPRQQLSS